MVASDYPELPSSETQDDLVREHQALLAFVNAAPVGVVQITRNGDVDMINAFSAMMLMPLSRNGMLSNLFEVLDPVLPTLRAHIGAFGPAHGLVVDNLRLDLNASHEPLKVAALRVIRMDTERVMVVITDVTDQVLAEQATLKAKDIEHKMHLIDAENQRLLEVSRLKSQFVGNLSHELRTPLTSILGYADLLAGGRVAAGTPRFKDALSLIGKQGRLLLQLINDLLDMSAMQSDKFDFHPSACDVGVLTHEVVEILQGNAQQQGVEVGVHVAPDSGTLWLDGRRFKQVMYNLVSNAIKFTPQGGRVRVRVQPDGPHLHVQVQDTGIGIAAEYVGSLFVDFHQLDGSRTRPFEGAGLGLALTRRLVEAQGGEVGVHSTLGQGSEFWVKLPLSRASS